MIKLKRIKAGEYNTLDGKFLIRKNFMLNLWFAADIKTLESVVDCEKTLRKIRESLERYLMSSGVRDKCKGDPESSTEVESIPVPEESAEETAKKTEIALDVLINGTTETKMTDSEVDYDVDMHIKSEQHSYWDSYTVKATTRCKAIEIALDRLVNEAGINKTSVDCIRIYKSGESELLKEYCYESDDEKIPNLTKFNNAIIKALGMTHAKEVGYTVQGVNVFFEFKGSMYKYYTPQSKLYKLSGQRFNLITWKDLKKESSEIDDDSGDIYTARPPPESSLRNLSIK